MGGRGASYGGFVYSVKYRQSAIIDQRDQNKHIKGTIEYDIAIAKGDNPSILTENAQNLLKQGAGKGHMRENKEIVDYKKNIGKYVDPTTGKYHNTTRGTIHYDKKGNAHIVPTQPKWMLYNKKAK